jgi:hypothetical protein
VRSIERFMHGIGAVTEPILIVKPTFKKTEPKVKEELGAVSIHAPRRGL